MWSIATADRRRFESGGYGCEVVGLPWMAC